MAEYILRKKGYRPWPAIDRSWRRYGGFLTKDPQLGLHHKPGTFVIRSAASGQFTVNHNEEALRITAKTVNNDYPHKREQIWVFGCTQVYGWGLNDEDTFPWQLQQKLPEYEILNFGVCGYSNLQSLIQFKKALRERDKPGMIIVCYGQFHDERNTFQRSWRKTLNAGKQFEDITVPAARIDRERNLIKTQTRLKYRALPFMRYSALVHYMDQCFDRFQDFFYRKHEVSRVIMEEFAEICRQEGIKMIIGGLTGDLTTHRMLRYCKREGIRVVDISDNRREPSDAVIADDAVKYNGRTVQAINNGVSAISCNRRTVNGKTAGETNNSRLSPGRESFSGNGHSRESIRDGTSLYRVNGSNATTPSENAIASFAGDYAYSGFSRHCAETVAGYLINIRKKLARNRKRRRDRENSINVNGQAYQTESAAATR